MTILHPVPDRARMMTRGKVAARTSFGLGADRGGVYPVTMSAWQVDEYRMMAGWPVEVPDYDIVTDSLVSCEGEVLSFRESPRLVETGALIRWIADEETYDQVSLRWLPYQTQLDAVLETAPQYYPTFLSQYEYRHDDERFLQDAVNFDADSKEHMWLDLSNSLGGAAGYTVIMAVNLHSAFGNSDQVYSGLWSPGKATPLTDSFTETTDMGWMSVSLQAGYLFLETDQSARIQVLPVSNLLELSAPIYLAFVFGRPYTHIYAAAGPSGIQHAKTYTGAQHVGLTGQNVLGRSTGDTLHTADMALLDLGIYGDRLLAQDVKDEFAILSGLYGGDK